MQEMLEAATDPQTVLEIGIQLGVAKAHLLALSMPMRCIPPRQVISLTKGMAAAAFHALDAITQMHSSPSHEILRKAIEIHLQGYADRLDELFAKHTATPSSSETIQ